MNVDNLRRARKALLVYQDAAEIRDDEEALSDLIADLGHYADRHDIDFVACCTRAVGALALERQGEHATAKTPNVVIQIGGVP